MYLALKEQIYQFEVYLLELHCDKTCTLLYNFWNEGSYKVFSRQLTFVCQ